MAGFGALITSSPLLLTIARWGGAIFLGYYGFRSFRSAFKSSALNFDATPERPTLKVTILTVLALSLLNPHVYLDTVVLLGSIGAQFPTEERLFCFLLGAMLASFIWFFCLGYGAAYLGPVFQKPLAWKILDFLIGCVMWIIALALLLWAPSCACAT